MAPKLSTADRKSKKDQEIMNLAAKVSERVAKKTANKVALSPNFEDSFEENDDSDDGLTSFSYDEGNNTKDDIELENVATGDQVVKENELRDVFEIGNEVMKAEGVPVKYYIRRNGSLAGTEKAPFSVEQLQEKYGAGEYQIQAKKATNGKFVKQQSLSLEAPLDNRQNNTTVGSGHSAENLMNSFEAILATTQEQSKETVDKLLAMQKEREEKEETRRREEQERNERRLQEERERMNKDTNSQTNLLATVLQTLQPKPDNSATQVLQMVQESNRMFMTGLEKISDSTNRMFEKLIDKQERDNEKAEQKRENDRRELFSLIEKLKDQQNNAPKQDPLEMFKLLKDAQREALEDYQERRAMLREELEEFQGTKTPPEPKSLTDKVLESLGPILMAGAQMKGMGQAQPPQFLPQETHVPQTQVVKASPSLKKIAPATQQRPVVATKVATASVKPVVKAQTTQSTVAPKNVVESNPEASKINTEVTLKGQIIAYAGDVLGAGLMTLQSPNPVSAAETAHKVAEGIVLGGLTVVKAVEVVKYEDIEHEAFVKNNLPRIEVLENYLKDFYETLLNIAQAELGNTTNSQGANP